MQRCFRIKIKRGATVDTAINYATFFTTNRQPQQHYRQSRISWDGAIYNSQGPQQQTVAVPVPPFTGLPKHVTLHQQAEERCLHVKQHSAQNTAFTDINGHSNMQDWIMHMQWEQKCDEKLTMCTMEGEDKMSTVDNDFRINVTEHDRAIKKKEKKYQSFHMPSVPALHVPYLSNSNAHLLGNCLRVTIRYETKTTFVVLAAAYHRNKHQCHNHHKMTKLSFLVSRQRWSATFIWKLIRVSYFTCLTEPGHMFLLIRRFACVAGRTGKVGGHGVGSHPDPNCCRVIIA